MQDWHEIVFSEELDFESKTRKVFDYQFEHNPVYRRFCEALGYGTDRFETPPLLPIRAFKDARVVTIEEDSESGNQHSEFFFQSSGTGNMKRSRHIVADISLYRSSLLKGFRHFYDLDQSVIWGYTPGYADNPHSSLVWMVRELIEQAGSGLSRFLPLGKPIDAKALRAVEESGKKLILFGAAFGLIDLAEQAELNLPSGSTVIETGGMKTYRREITRAELHRRLAEGFGVLPHQVHSEYGMAELLSQAYATGGKWFRTVPWMQVSIRNPDNPEEILPSFYEGVIGITDLANIHSCSFILTGDRGVMDKKGRFQVLGRWNPKDLRGCNFLIEED